MSGVDSTLCQLSGACTGDTLEVRAILFGSLRHECSRMGIVQGVRFVLRDDTPTHLHLDRCEGGSAVLRREWTRFIQVAPVPPCAELLPRSPIPA
jgi:hypothetical protein